MVRRIDATATSCRSRSRSSCPGWSTERGRAANTIAAYRRDLTALHPLAARATATTSTPSTRRRSSTSSPSAGPAAPPRRASPASWPRCARCTATSSPRASGADDPTADLEGVRVPAGLPKPLSEAEVTSLLDAVVGTRSGRPARPGAARAALRHRGPHLRGVRAVDGRHRLRRPARAAVRQGVQGAHRAVRAGRRRRRSTSGSRRAAGCCSCRRSGAGATTPRPCSSTAAAGG